MTISELTETRRFLHQYPELSGEERQTQKFIHSKLRGLGADAIREVGDTGLAVFFKGKEAGEKVLLRADMDALPIHEINEFDHRSKNIHVSHACGHDGHSTIMLGVADHLIQNPPERGEVCLIFQPGEENGIGARAILDDENFQFDADQAYALHNLPGYPLHKIVCRKGSFTAAVKSVIFKLYGKTSHAAEPELGINPGLAMSEILQLSEELSEKNISKKNFRMITHVYASLGEKSYGVSAGYGEIHLTLRSWENKVMEELQKEMVKRAGEIALGYGLDIEDEWLEIFHANQNDGEVYENIKSTAHQQNLEFEERDFPFKWGEDFGLFTETHKGAMFGIGGGEELPALHNPDYDFPDEIIETGIKMFTGILRNQQLIK